MSAARRIGIHVPPFGELADPGTIAELAVLAERAGFDGFFLWDHIDRPHRGAAVADATVCLAAVACHTSRVRVGALVTALPRRRPAKFARETASLDQLSHGRLVVGVGIGVDSGGELSRLGEVSDAARRGDQLDEALALVTALWSGERVHHRGASYTADDVAFTPTPFQLPRPPVWVASRRSSGRPVRRAARFDGVVVDLSLEEMPALVATLARERGHLDGFDIVAKGAPQDDPEPWFAAGATWWLVALPEGVTRATAEAVINSGPP